MNACDKHGNTPLHMVCGRQAGPVIMQDIRLLVRLVMAVDSWNAAHTDCCEADVFTAMKK